MLSGNVWIMILLDKKTRDGGFAVRVFEELGLNGGLLHGLGLDGGRVLALFLVGMNAKIDLNSFALGGRFDEASDGGGGKTLSADQRGNVRLTEDEAEVHLVLTGVPDAKLGQLGVLDELKGDVLDEVLNLGGDLFHGVRFCRSLS